MDWLEFIHMGSSTHTQNKIRHSTNLENFQLLQTSAECHGRLHSMFTVNQYISCSYYQNSKMQKPTNSSISQICVR